MLIYKGSGRRFYPHRNETFRLANLLFCLLNVCKSLFQEWSSLVEFRSVMLWIVDVIIIVLNVLLCWCYLDCLWTVLHSLVLSIFSETGVGEPEGQHRAWGCSSPGVGEWLLIISCLFLFPPRGRFTAPQRTQDFSYTSCHSDTDLLCFLNKMFPNTVPLRCYPQFPGALMGSRNPVWRRSGVWWSCVF